MTLALPKAFDESNRYTTPETRVMIAVILNAINDACGRDPDTNTRERNRIRSTAWFRDCDENFQSVCSLAGLDPQNVRTAALTYIESNQFTPAKSPFGVSMRAIAELAEVSVTTASRVMHKQGTVRADCVARVRSAFSFLTTERAAA